jgi:serine/threonine-protein kinase
MEEAMTSRAQSQVAEAEPVAASDKVATIGKYTIFAGIGSGGMAEVFLGVMQGSLGFNKLVVVKRLRASLVDEDENFANMFLDEARLAARLNHPNIVHTYEVGSHGRSLFIAMEFLDGQPLRRVRDHALRRGQPMPMHLAARVTADALAGLHYAHELKDYDGKPLKIVHRDVSPHNIFVTYDGTVKIVDFGIAKAAVNSTETAFGTFKGKPGYMAPEQATSKDQDCRADIFAMGIILYELVTGTRLFPGDAVQALTALISAPIPLASSVRPEVDSELDAIIDKALQRKPENRYASADKMRQALESWARKHQPATDEPDLSGYVSEMFKDVRENIRKRIEVHMAQAQARAANSRVSMVDQSMTGLSMIGATQSGVADTVQPPTIDLGSGSGRSVLSASLQNAVTPTRRKAGAAYLGAIGVGVLLTLGALTLNRRSHEEAHAAPAAAPPAAPPIVMAPPVIAQPESTPPAKARGTFVTVVSDPQGALVQWNGRAMGVTPATVELPAGAQVLTISKDGYGTSELSVDVPASSDQPLLRTARLRSTGRSGPAPQPRGSRSSAPASTPSDSPPPAPSPAVVAAAPLPTADGPKAPTVRVIEDPRTKVRSLE